VLIKKHFVVDMDVVLTAAGMTEDIVEDFARQLDEGTFFKVVKCKM
jgi:RNA-binding protein YhbY